MRLALIVNGVEQNLELLSPAPECRFRLDGVERVANVQAPEPGVYSVLLEGRSYDARIEETPAGLVVVIDGSRFEIEVRDPRRWSRVAAGRGKEGLEKVCAPMPGKVVRVLVAAGDAVESGQGLVVVEAMKMQNEMKASRNGTVRSVAAKEGATVTAGEVLATIE